MLYAQTRFIGEARNIVRSLNRIGKKATMRAEKISGIKTWLIYIY